MNADKVKQIVSEAFDLEKNQRDTFVRKSCGEDPSLLAEVLSLLDAASNAEDDGFLPSRHDGRHANSGDVATVPESQRLNQPADTTAPEQFGRYKVLERIGEGGMGIVYRAEQRVPMRREVVVKVIKLGMDTKLVIARFEAERQALAMMDHPHIAKVYDAGTDDRGRPYFVMEYVKGTPILDYCDRNHLAVKQRLELFTQVCQAIQHAHHKGIIHRDIKPSNILVSTQDGKPFAKVIDFGIAKATNQRLTDRTLFTEHVNMIGTPAYMSPEQADGNIDIDTRTDVYSLGVVLYELLTGHTPFDASRLKMVALNEIARIIREEDPPKPSTRVNTLDSRLAPKKETGNQERTLATVAKARGSSAEAYVKSLQGEIDWMVMKAIEKDRARRYATPNELAEDVERHLNGLPIVAAPPSLLYQAKKFARKYRAPVAAGLVIAGVLCIAIAVVSALAIKLSGQVAVTKKALVDVEAARKQEVAQREEADRQRQEAERQRGSAESASHAAKYEAARNQTYYLIAQKLLDQALVSAKQAYNLGGTWRDGLLLSQIVNEARQSWTLAFSVPISEQPICSAICPDPEGGVLICAFPSSVVEYGLGSGRVLAQTKPIPGIQQLVAFTDPKSHRVLAVSNNSLQTISLDVLTVMNRQEFGALNVIAAAGSASTFAVTLSDRSTQLYSDDLKLLGTQPWPKDAKLNGNQALEKLVISPDGEWVISSGITAWNDCLFWNTKTDKTFLHVASAQTLRFIDNTSLYGIYGLPSGTTVNRIKIDPDKNSAEVTWLSWLPVDETGQFFFHAAAGSDGLHFNGDSGFATLVRSDTVSTPVTERYASLLGRNDLSPKTTAMSFNAFCFALACKDRLLCFFSANPFSSAQTLGTHAAVGKSAMYEIALFNTSLLLRVTPADPQLAPFWQRMTAMPEAAPDNLTVACGACVSKDQRTLAVRFAEVLKGSHAASIHNHCVMIYPGLDPLTGKPGTTPPIQIQLITQGDNAADAVRENNNERILELSPDGKYLLVGTRLTVAELYRASDGALIHYWRPGQLSRLVNTIGDDQCFADVSPAGDSIQLISWQTGEVARQLKMPGSVTGFCGAANGQEIVASIDEKSLVRISTKTGEVLHKSDSSILPVDCSPDGKVMTGYLADAGGVRRGSMLLIDRDNAEVLAVVAHGCRIGTPARFVGDGRAFMLATNEGDERLVRNLTPDAADQVLQSGVLGNLPQIQELKVTPIKVFPVAPADTVANTAEKLEATDMPALTARIGTSAIVEGTVTNTGLGPSHALFINFGPRGKSFVVYVPANLYPAVNARFGGTALTTLKNQRVRIRGNIIAYNQLPEIKIDDATQIELIDSPTTEPAP